MKKIIINTIILVNLIIPGFVYSADMGNNEKIKQYDKEKITFEFKEQFDVLYPANIKLFYFKKGNDKITFNEFIQITNDPNLMKINDKVKKTKLAGFSSTGVFGVVGLLLLIPSIIYIVKQTNNDKIDYAFTITGNVCIGLVGASFLGMLIGLITTISLLYNYKYSVPSIRRAVENYNEKLREKLGILPDISFNRFNQNDVDISFSYKF